MKKIKNAPVQEEIFTKYSVPRVLARFVIPAALSQLTFLILNLADAFFVWRTGDTFQISAIGIVGAVFQSMNRWQISMANTLINKGLMLTPVMVLLAKLNGINGIVVSQPITENLTAFVLLITYIIVMKKETSEQIRN